MNELTRFLFSKSGRVAFELMPAQFEFRAKERKLNYKSFEQKASLDDCWLVFVG